MTHITTFYLKTRELQILFAIPVGSTMAEIHGLLNIIHCHINFLTRVYRDIYSTFSFDYSLWLVDVN